MERFNEKMNILSALGIVLVVGGHSGFNFIPEFPVYSFHMPLFVFISGYFFHAYDFPTFFKKKCLRLMAPLVLWTWFYVCLTNALHGGGLVAWHYSSVSTRVLWDTLVCGWPAEFNVPAWFLTTLFWAQLLYWGIHRLARGNLLLIGGGNRRGVLPGPLPELSWILSHISLGWHRGGAGPVLPDFLPCRRGVWPVWGA